MTRTGEVANAASVRRAAEPGRTSASARPARTDGTEARRVRSPAEIRRTPRAARAGKGRVRRLEDLPVPAAHVRGVETPRSDGSKAHRAKSRRAGGASRQTPPRSPPHEDEDERDHERAPQDVPHARQPPRESVASLRLEQEPAAARAPATPRRANQARGPSARAARREAPRASAAPPGATRRHRASRGRTRRSGPSGRRGRRRREGGAAGPRALRPREEAHATTVRSPPRLSSMIHADVSRSIGARDERSRQHRERDRLEGVASSGARRPAKKAAGAASRNAAKLGRVAAEGPPEERVNGRLTSAKSGPHQCCDRTSPSASSGRRSRRSSKRSSPESPWRAASSSGRAPSAGEELPRGTGRRRAPPRRREAGQARLERRLAPHGRGVYRPGAPSFTRGASTGTSQ